MKRVTSLLLVQGLCFFHLGNAASPPDAPLLITEFVANNTSTLADEEGEFADWIEIHNTGTNTVNLLDWSLTDNPANLTKWRFPSTTLAAKGYLVVFASEKNRRVPGAPLHTNFKLASDGEYLALLRPDGSVASAFAPAYPAQAPNISYGLGKLTVQTTLLETGVLARVLVPIDDVLGLNWVNPDFEDLGWTNGPTGVGYQTTIPSGGADFGPLIQTDIRSQMFDSNSSVFIRIPFAMENPPVFDHLMLKMKFDDGFVAYLNGTEVVANRQPADPVWNSASLNDRPDGEALVFEDFGLDDELGFLHAGTNVLAIHGLNSSKNNTNFLILPKLVAGTDITDTNALRYFTMTTPGSGNVEGVTNLGPIISEVAQAPVLPADNDNIVVTARVTPTFGPVASVILRYRIMFTNEVSVMMLDDGLSGDGPAGDGVYGGTIPASASLSGEMVRWYISVTDTGNRSSRWPAFVESLNSPQYLGTIVSVTITSGLPIIHWFVEKPALAERDPGTRCSLFYDGEFYDNVEVRIRGQAARGYAKKSYKFDFNTGHHFRWDRNEKRVDEINVNTTYADKSYVRVTLAWESFRDAGAPYSTAFPLRLQQNNAFYSVATFVEVPDEIMLERNGLDPHGALYKMYNSLESAGGNKKQTRTTEDFSDLQALVNGIRSTNPNRVQYLFDNVNIAAMINYMAVIAVIHDNDCPHKNYFMYRDSEGTREWEMLPWDKDLSIGRNWDGGLSDVIWANRDTLSVPGSIVSPSHPFFMDQFHQKVDSQWNRLVDALYSVPAIKEMYVRRLRTVIENLLQPPNTPAPLLKFDKRMDQLFTLMEPDVVLDRAKWARFQGYGMAQDFITALNAIRTNYLPLRRIHLFNTHSVTNASYSASARIPLAQPGTAVILFGAVEASPVSGRQSEEYVELINRNPYAVDISGWRITGTVTHTFQAGAVVPAGSSVYVSPDAAAFRARTISPRGGQSLFVQGNYEGDLSARGGTLRLLDQNQREVDVRTYPGAPSLAQQYLRVTEIMYHPAAPLAGGAYTTEDFEYLELKNIGPVPLDLTGVHFTNGIQFHFTGSAVTNLAADQHVLVVKNLGAFSARYGSGLNVAGQYLGSLDNGGENVRLDDALGEPILDFSYDNSWYPATDGLGFSLVIVDENAPFDTWGLKESWRPSGLFSGSPAQNDPPPLALAPVVINEVLSHTDPPEMDAIELYNQTTNEVNIGGWFLSDDFLTPRKFRIPAGTTIPGGGYLVLREGVFNPNPGVPPSFSFSSKGDQAYLFGGDANTNLTGYFHGFEFGAAENGVSFGRYLTSLGEEHFVAQITNTLGASNAGPKVGPIVVSEIMYHPPDLPGPQDNSDAEYLELRNLTASVVPLYDPVHPTNTWRISGEVDYVFPTNVSMPSNGYFLLVSFDPNTNAAALAVFQTLYAAANVPIFGPYDGKLNNSDGAVVLSKPDPPEMGTSEIPYVIVDQIDYEDAGPWPTTADGAGVSLQRKILAAYGNDPSNWLAAAPSPGRSLSEGLPPVITMPPTNQSVMVNTDATLSVMAEGAGPLHYQWRLHGVNLVGATQPTLLLTNVQPGQDGNYSVVVFNAAGSAASAAAILKVNFPLTVTFQPESQSVHPYTNVTLGVVVHGSTPIFYQWRFHGTNIAGATNSTLTLTNVLPIHDGPYSIQVSNTVGPIISDTAVLTVYLTPFITSQPTNQTARPGGNVMFRVAASSSTPIFYEWRLNGQNIVGATNSTFAITNVQSPNRGIYTVMLTDSFGSIVGAPALFTLLVNPVITKHPQSQTVLEGDTVTFSVRLAGTPPFGYRWRRGGNTLLAFGKGMADLTITNVQFSDANNYDVIVTNLANLSPGILSSNAVLTVLADSDHDRIADVWESANGLATNNVGDALLDLDGDRMTNLEEFQAGTDPRNDQSVLRLGQVIMTGDDVRVSFRGVSGKKYRLERQNMEGGVWSPVVDFKVSSVLELELIDTGAASRPHRMYRVLLIP